MEGVDQPVPPEPSVQRSPAPYVVFAAGVLFTLALQTTIRDEVFFSGDGGLKALFAKQWVAGRWNFDLRLPADDRVRELWREGYYPFAPPFVYPLAESPGRKFFLAFPVWFPIASAPFYALLGFRGLYVLPLVSTWLLWWRFAALCGRLTVSAKASTLALAALIFASPLTLYSATFWEHAPAVALAFCGLAELVAAAGGRASPGRMALGGALIGLAVWLRPECVCLAVGAVVAWFATTRSLGGNRGGLGLVGALLASSGALLVVNALIYGQPLGTHAFEALGRLTGGEGLSTTWLLLRALNADLILFTPVHLFVLGCAVVAALQRRFPPGRPVRFLVIVLAFSCLTIPLIVPNEGGSQWGPRFMLAVVPVSCLAAGLLLDRLAVGSWGRVAFALALLAGAAWNVGAGVTVLAQQYGARVLPALEALRGERERLVVVAHQFVAQELEAAMTDRTFLRCETNEDFERLAPLLHQHGVKTFLFILAVYDAHPVARQMTWTGDGARVTALMRGRFSDDYYFYDCQVSRVPSAESGVRNGDD